MISGHDAPDGAETRFAAARTLPTGWHHVAVVIDGTAMTFKLYLDGTVVAEGSTTVLPKDLGMTTQNWLGRSQLTADGYLSACWMNSGSTTGRCPPARSVTWPAIDDNP